MAQGPEEQAQRRISFYVAIAGFVVAGCSGVPAEGADGYEPTSVIDPVTGEPVAINYTPPDGPVIYVDDLSEEKVLSQAFQDVWDGPAITQAVVDLPRDFLIVGVGGRVAASPPEFTTLVVHARRHNADGTLGPIFEFRGGSVPNAGMETWCAAPVGFVIAGIGGRIADYNLTTLHIWERPYDPVTRTLGPVEIEPRRCGSVPGAGWERRIVTWEHTSGADEDRTVFNGLVMTEGGNNINAIRARLRVIQ